MVRERGSGEVPVRKNEPGEHIMAIKAFLLIGQSNMAGRGDFGEVPEIRNDHIWMLRNGRWIQMAEPVNPVRPIWGQFHSGVGLSASFAEAYVKDHPDDIAGLIPCADGGTGLSDWEPGGELYDNALFQVKQARRSAEIAGILWHQGENDASSPEKAVRYRGRLEAFIASLRRDGHLEGVPFIVGELGRYLATCPYDGLSTGYETINQALHAVAEESPLVGIAGSEGLKPKDDGLHFRSASLRELGRRYYKAWKEIERYRLASGHDLFPDAVIEKHWVTMKDGKRLFTLVKKPKAEGRYPVILWRTPYDTPENEGEALLKTDTGDYAVVQQQCRGTARSEGEFVPYVDERSDGLATLDWIRKQPFYNGEIYPQGGSYLSSVHLSYLDTRPADIPTADLAVQDCNQYNVLFKNGFYKTGLAGSWGARHYKPTTIRERNFCDETFLMRPTAGITKAVFGEYADMLEHCMLHEKPDDPFWQTHEGGADYRDAVSAFDKPLLLTTSFYDLYTEGVFDMWGSLQRQVREKSVLIVTPYAHDYQGSTVACHFENGFLSFQCPGLGTAWFDYQRGKAPLPEFLKLGKIVYFPIFGREWRYRDFLSDGASPWHFFLNGDQTLGKEQGPECAMTYLYNPAAPARFRGGVCNAWGGMQQQDKPDSRYDIKSFLGAPIEGQHLMEGGGHVRLLVRSDRPDTCFYVRLSIVKDGKAWSLRDDITSLRFQHPGYQPGKTVPLDFSFAPHAYWIEPGDRLRLDISSSCFPYYLTHTNRPGVQALQTGADIAHNTVILGPSEILLHETPIA